MKIKILKPYWIIGSLVTAGIIITTGYNVIVANTQKEIVNASNSATQLQQNDYSSDIVELKQRITDMETKVSALEERIISLENNSNEKDKTISNLQNKVDTLKKQSSTKNIQISNLEEELKNSKQKTNEVQNDLQQTKQVLEKRSKRLSEIQKRLEETAKLPQDYERIQRKIDELKEKEQTEEVVNKINELQIQYKEAKKIRDEVLVLNEEMRQLLYGEISL